MAKTIKEALQKGELFSDRQTYRFLKLPLTSVSKAASVIASSDDNDEYYSSFRGLLVDKDEITLMVSSQLYETNRQLLGDDCEAGEVNYRLITFDVVLDPTLIGFMAKITKALAAAKISVLPFAAYSRDHIFVAASDFDKAMQVLEDLKKESL